MKNKLTDLIKKVVISSVAGIVANDTANAASYSVSPVKENSDNELIAKQPKDLGKKLLLKRNKDSQWFTMAHRSHRSHSSHRSHYSSTTGRTRPTTSPTQRNTGTPTRSNTTTTSSPLPRSSNSTLTPTTLKLGDRNLKLGMAGSDVTQLVNILIKKGYLQLENGETQVTGIYTYDQTIEAVVKRFQRDHDLPADGTCGPTTTYYLLKKENESNTK